MKYKVRKFVSKNYNSIRYANYSLSVLVGLSVSGLIYYVTRDPIFLVFLILYLLVNIPYIVYADRFFRYVKFIERLKVLTNISIKQIIIDCLKSQKVDSTNYFNSFNNFYYNIHNGEYSYTRYLVFYDSTSNIFYSTHDDYQNESLSNVLKRSRVLDMSKFFTMKHVLQIVFSNEKFGKYTPIFQVIRSTFNLSEKEFYDYAEVYFTGIGYINKNLINFDLENNIWHYSYNNQKFKFLELKDLINSIKNT